MEARSVQDARTNSEDSAENDGGGGHVSSIVLVRGVPAAEAGLVTISDDVRQGKEAARAGGLIARASRGSYQPPAAAVALRADR